MPGLTIGDTIPNIEAESTHGKINLHDFVGDNWAILFSHPGLYQNYIYVYTHTKLLLHYLFFW